MKRNSHTKFLKTEHEKKYDCTKLTSEIQLKQYNLLYY